MENLARDLKAAASIQAVENILTRNGFPLYHTVTKFNTQCSSFPDSFTEYFERVKNAKTDKAQQAEVAKMIANVLSPCAPIVAQIFVCTQNFVTKALAFFEADESAKKLSEQYDLYLKEMPEEKIIRDHVQLYLVSVDKFRTYMQQQNIEFAEAPRMFGTVKTELEVGKDSAIVLKMLERMKQLRATRLGNTSTVGAQHVNDAVTALSGNFNAPILVGWKSGIYTERSTAGGGMSYNETSASYVSNDGKMLLLSTAIVHMRQRKNVNDLAIIKKIEDFINGNEPTDAIAKRNYGLLSRAVAEADAFSGELDGAAAGWQNQSQNIDPLWYTFFILKLKCDIKNASEFYVMQRGWYAACSQYRGNVNMRAVLSGLIAQGLGKFQNVLNSLSTIKDIHLPPWILKVSRMYDIAACIGACDSANPANTIGKPAVSWRYFHCLDFGNSPKAIAFVTALWEMEDTINKNAEEDIRLSERILHQVILGRSSPMACTNFLTGNALNVTIKPKDK